MAVCRCSRAIYTRMKAKNNVSKIGIQRSVFKLAANGKHHMALLFTSKFCLKASGALPRGYIHALKHEKKICIKSGVKEFVVKFVVKIGQSDKAFLLT